MLERFKQAKKEPERESPDANEEIDKEGLSRRKFMQLGASAALAGAFTLDLAGQYPAFAQLLDPNVAVDQFDYDKAVGEAKRFFKQGYDVNLFVGAGNEHSYISGGGTTIEKYRDSLRLLTEEFEGKYTDDMIKQLGKGRGGLGIRIASNLAWTKKNDQGDTIVYKETGLVPGSIPGKSAPIFLNADNREDFQRQLIHHEMQHRAFHEREDQEVLLSQWRDVHKGVSLGEVYRPREKGVEDRGVPSESYFLTNYAGTSVWEDMATCAEWIMTPLQFAKFIERIRTEKDPVLKEILEKKFIATRRFYEKWDGGEKINTAFWERMGTEGYRQLLKEITKKPPEQLARVR